MQDAKTQAVHTFLVSNQICELGLTLVATVLTVALMLVQKDEGKLAVKCLQKPAMYIFLLIRGLMP